MANGGHRLAALPQTPLFAGAALLGRRSLRAGAGSLVLAAMPLVLSAAVVTCSPPSPLVRNLAPPTETVRAGLLCLYAVTAVGFDDSASEQRTPFFFLLFSCSSALVLLVALASLGTI